MVGSLTLLVAIIGVPRTAEAIESQVCYIVADTGGGNGGDDLLLKVDSEATPPRNFVQVGTGTGTNSIEAAAAQPGTNLLFAADQDGTNNGRLGIIDLTTGVFTARPQVMGSGDGARDTITFRDPDGLTFDPASGTLYASIRIGDSSAPPDVLIQLDPVTGAHIPGAFGTDINGNPIDYIEIEVQGGRNDIDGIAFAPSVVLGGAQPNTLYGVANQGAGDPQILVEIDPTTGNTTIVGNIPLPDVEDLAFDIPGQLYASTGRDGKLFDLSISGSTISAEEGLTPGIGRDYESSGCYLEPPVDLSLLKAADNLTPNQNEVVEFTLTLANDQTDFVYHDANDVEVEDVLPTGLTFVAFTNIPSGSTASENNGTITWSVDEVLLGQSQELRFTARATGVGTIINSAEVIDLREFDLDSTPNNNRPSEDDQDSVTLTVTTATGTNPEVILVKRITAINGTPTVTVDPNTTPELEDNDAEWPSNFLEGAVSAPVMPSDIVDYTIYFLNTGDGAAENLTICDILQSELTFIPDAYNAFSADADAGVGSGTDLGIRLDDGATTKYLSALSLDSDRGRFIEPATNLDPECDPTDTSPIDYSNAENTVVVDVTGSDSGQNPNIAPGTAGLVRFRVRVD
ncbi:DUF11 domain-containing protein [[Limnothrix rosea] IAM M-220]|uniref:DUF11 domain-containing protein n=1 Tax=[Limnothrix rosea] IAM M-220 TaxID=454133 RepID=UPI00095F9B84|nr:DUF11 domain-containing protein [[Limnothrix rosea] IAM M-220]OKH19925.1 hypothetical protein NIES208_00120 [[Limnothrix rosea] IAM M-220]